MIKRCEICGQEFVAKRKTAKYCSDTCRTRHFRGVAVAPVTAPKLNVMMPDDEVLQVIAQAHSAASDLSRAAMFTPPALSQSLKRIGKRLEDALRSEGL